MTDARAAYARSGVDVAAGERAVDLMRASVASTRRPEVLGGLGGFGSAIAIPAGYREPVIVSSTDGVGTKTAIAAGDGAAGHDRDRPRRDVRRRRRVHRRGAAWRSWTTSRSGGWTRSGRDAGRRDRRRAAGEAGAALVGGETAEHPGLMEPDDVRPRGVLHRGGGARSALLDGTAARAGDAIVGLASSGLHANGYSLVRALVARAPARARRAVRGASAALGEARPRRPRGRSRSWRGDAGRGPADPDPDLRPRPARRPGRACVAEGTDLRGDGPRHRRRAARRTSRARCPGDLGARLDPSAWPMPSVMRVLAALGGSTTRSCEPRSTAGLGMVAGGAARRPARTDRRTLARERGDPGVGRRRGRGGGALGGAVRGGRAAADERPDRRRRLGHRLQPARARTRPRRAASWAARSCSCSPTAPAPRSTGRRSRGSTPILGRPAGRRRDASRRRSRPSSADVVVLAGLHAPRRARRCWRAFAGRILNVHPSLLPGVPGPARGARRARGRRRASPASRSTSSTRRSTAARSWPRRPSRVAARRRRGDAPRRGSTPWSTGCCRGPSRRSWPAPSSVAGRRRATARPGGRRRAACPSRAGRCSRVSDKAGLADLGRGLVARGCELVSTGGTARALREAGLPVTDVAAVTGFPEMLDGRVKTLHPAIHAGLLADRRRADHREALARRRDRPVRARRRQPVPVRGGRRASPGITFDELVEEIDIGGPSMVRAAAKNHASRRDRDLARRATRRSSPRSTSTARIPLGLRSALAVEAFRAHGRVRRPDRRRAAVPDARRGDRAARRSPACPAPRDPYPPVLTIPLEKVETLRYGENPHQPAARYRRTDREPRAERRAVRRRRRRRSRARRSRTTTCSTRRRRRRSPGCCAARRRHRQAHEPVRRRGAPDAPRGLGGGPRRRPGVGVRRRRRAHAARSTARSRARSTSIFLEVVVAPAFDDGRARGPRHEAQPAPGRGPGARRRGGPLRAHGARPARRRLPGLDPDRRRRGPGRPRRTTSPDDPAEWVCLTTRAADRRARRPTSTSPGACAAASCRTRSCWCATGSSSGSGRGR